MTSKHAIVAVMLLAGAPAFAAGDPVKGEAVFKQCQTCHVVANEAGEVLAGKNAKMGPNLYAVIGRQVGSYPDFKYGESIVAAGATGLVWDEAGFIAYVQDPTNHWKVVLNDKGAKSKMAFKVKNAEAAADVYAFLAQFSPAPAAAADPAAATTTTTTTTSP
jgi:cytochrome c